MLDDEEPKFGFRPNKGHMLLERSDNAHSPEGEICDNFRLRKLRNARARLRVMLKLVRFVKANLLSLVLSSPGYPLRVARQQAKQAMSLQRRQSHDLRDSWRHVQWQKLTQMHATKHLTTAMSSMTLRIEKGSPGD